MKRITIEQASRLVDLSDTSLGTIAKGVKLSNLHVPTIRTPAIEISGNDSDPYTTPKIVNNLGVVARLEALSTTKQTPPCDVYNPHQGSKLQRPTRRMLPEGFTDMNTNFIHIE